MINRGLFLVCFILFYFSFVSSSGVPECNTEGQYIDTNSCDNCNTANSGWNSGATGRKYINSGAFGENIPSLSGYYFCDDFTSCNGADYSTRLCSYLECVSNSDCGSGEICSSYSCVSNGGNSGGENGGCSPSWDTCSLTCGGGTQSDGCGASQSCNTQLCQFNQPCTSSSQCEAGLVCIAGFCNHNFNLNTTYWADLHNISRQINSANVGDSVLMVYGGTNLTNKTINYSVQVYSNANLTWWNPFSWFGGENWNSEEILFGNAYEVFVISQEYIHRFNSSVEDSSVYNLSNNLTISPSNNFLPVTKIISPSNNSRFRNGTLINFQQVSYDEDDLLNLNWNFGDGNSDQITDYSYIFGTDSGDSSHSYSSSGNYLVRLTASETGRPQSSSDSIHIQIFKEGINVFPVITSPIQGSVYFGSVFFNGSQSYVLNCSEGPESLDYYNFTTDDGLLYCKYLHSPGQARGQNLEGYRLMFNWTMNGQSFVQNVSSQSYFDSGGVEFLKHFFIPGRIDIKLRLSYEPLI